MAPRSSKPISIDVDAGPARLGPAADAAKARCCYVLAHGAGAGMAHPFMANVAAGLASAAIATLRYQFPYMEQGGRRADPPALAAGRWRGPPWPRRAAARAACR